MDASIPRRDNQPVQCTGAAGKRHVKEKYIILGDLQSIIIFCIIGIFLSFYYHHYYNIGNAILFKGCLQPLKSTFQGNGDKLSKIAFCVYCKQPLSRIGQHLQTQLSYSASPNSSIRFGVWDFGKSHIVGLILKLQSCACCCKNK